MCYQEPAINEFYDVYGEVPRSLLQHRGVKKNKEKKEKTDQVTIVELNSDEDEMKEANVKVKAEEDRKKEQTNNNNSNSDGQSNQAGPSRLVFHYCSPFELKLVAIKSLTKLIAFHFTLNCVVVKNKRLKQGR